MYSAIWMRPAKPCSSVARVLCCSWACATGAHPAGGVPPAGGEAARPAATVVRVVLMLKNAPFYAGYAVDDPTKAKAFYAETLGIAVDELGDGLLSLRAANGYAVLVYPKPGHVPA